MRIFGDDRDVLIKKRVHLVQSGHFRKDIDSIDNDKITGIDDIIDFDYMGSAEFEFGSLPRSLRRMTINKDYYSVFTFDEYKDKNGNSLKVYAPRLYFDNVKGIVDRLVVSGDGLQEYCSLHRNFMENDDNSTYYKYTSNFWWDIDNDFFIIFENTDKVLQAMDKLEERKFGIESNDARPALNRLSMTLLESTNSFLKKDWDTSIKDYHFDKNAGVHFIEFQEDELLEKILMEAIIIAKVDKGCVYFSINGIPYSINEDSKLDDIVRENGVALNEYSFFTSNIDELITQYNEEILRNKKGQELVYVLKSIRDKKSHN